MTRACLSLLAGMYALQLSSFSNASDYLSATLVAALVLLIARQWQLLFAFCVGVALFWIAAQQLIASRLPAAFAGDSMVVDLEVADFPSQDGATVSFLANPVNDARLASRIRLSWFEPPVRIRYGDRWQLEVRLRRPRGARNPGTFDFESWLFRERITAVGYVVGGRRNHLLLSEPGSAGERLRRRFVSRVVTLLDSREQAAVLTALVVGSRHLLSAEQWQRYAVTGTSHLMAISGLHIGLAASGAYVVALLLAGVPGGRTRQRNHHRYAIACSVLVAIIYAGIAGFAVPARRASLMLLLAAIALLRMRRPNLRAIVCVTAATIAVTDPLATMAPGFMLSFAAVALLIWVGQRRANLATLQLMLLCGLLPLTALLFARVSFAALPVNLLAVPLFGFVTVPLSLLGFLLDGPLQALGDQALLLAAGSIAVLETGLTQVAAMPWAALPVRALAGVAWLLLAAPALWALLPPGWPGRKLAWPGIVALLLYEPPGPAFGCAQVDILDVGQGLAVAIQTRQRTLVYDTGPAYRGGGSAAASVILPFLLQRGVRELDRLIVSHADLDHAGGTGTILDTVRVRQILAGEPLDGFRSTPCRAGQRWSYDGVNFQILYPPVAVQARGNDSSCVLMLQAGEYRILFSGDIEKAAERELVQRQQLPVVDAVIVPHHGSRTSSTAALVQALRPSFAIVSSGYDNHWGFPKQDVVQRWQAAGADVLNTALAGAVELRLCAGSGLELIREYRRDNRRIWHE